MHRTPSMDEFIQKVVSIDGYSQLQSIARPNNYIELTVALGRDMFTVLWSNGRPVDVTFADGRSSSIFDVLSQVESLARTGFPDLGIVKTALMEGPLAFWRVTFSEDFATLKADKPYSRGESPILKAEFTNSSNGLKYRYGTYYDTTRTTEVSARRFMKLIRKGS